MIPQPLSIYVIVSCERMKNRNQIGVEVSKVMIWNYEFINLIALIARCWTS